MAKRDMPYPKRPFGISSSPFSSAELDAASLTWSPCQCRKDHSLPSFREATSVCRIKFTTHLRNTAVADLCTMAHTEKILLVH